MELLCLRWLGGMQVLPEGHENFHSGEHLLLRPELTEVAGSKMQYRMREEVILKFQG